MSFTEFILLFVIFFLVDSFSHLSRPLSNTSLSAFFQLPVSCEPLLLGTVG